MHLDGLASVAEVAKQSGAHAGRAIGRHVRGAQDRRPFRYRDLGTMATVSRFRAIASIGNLRLSGFAGWLAWLLIHLVFLTGFTNRLATLAGWIVAFVGHGRPQRTITAQQVLARGAGLGNSSPNMEAASRSDRTGPGAGSP
jgi:NADH dehydrogenase